MPLSLGQELIGVAFRSAYAYFPLCPPYARMTVPGQHRCSAFYRPLESFMHRGKAPPEEDPKKQTTLKRAELLGTRRGCARATITVCWVLCSNQKGNTKQSDESRGTERAGSELVRPLSPQDKRSLLAGERRMVTRCLATCARLLIGALWLMFRR